MKTLPLAPIALACLATTSLAADLPTRDSRPQEGAVNKFVWEGAYIGGHLGGAWGVERDTLHVFFADVFEVSGATGGVHFGYNWASGDFVLGPEAEFDVTNLKGSRPTVGAVGFLAIRASWLASVRARLGYALGATMPYVAGGVAVTSATETLSLFALPTSQAKTLTGWTLGGGVEHAFMKNWIGRVEARYTDFGQARNFLQDNAFRSGFHDATVTVGLSYKF